MDEQSGESEEEEVMGKGISESEMKHNERSDRSFL